MHIHYFLHQTLYTYDTSRHCNMFYNCSSVSLVGPLNTIVCPKKKIVTHYPQHAQRLFIWITLSERRYDNLRCLVTPAPGQVWDY